MMFFTSQEQKNDRKKYIDDLLDEIIKKLDLKPENNVGQYEMKLDHTKGPYGFMTVLAEIVRRLPEKQINTPKQKITRFEIYDASGKVYISERTNMEFSLQDDGKVLQLFTNEEDY